MSTFESRQQQKDSEDLSRTFALHAAADFVADWRRVRSMIYFMDATMDQYIANANAKPSEMEHAKIWGDEFRLNMSWLADIMDDRAKTLSEEIESAGVQK